ncbi:MAG: SDR family NAD(P)-dependent oxidoreductase [Tannerella sp.]|jgi:short-subunit dehydrogenase|nr:SDR family NAD(P)-dependent oxidoreductase [Tannerella sp.]
MANNKKRAIVVGATSGIGRGLAIVLAENGYRVGITGRRTELLDELKALHPEAFVTKPFDVSATADVERHLDELTAELGGIDLLVICAGAGHRNPSLLFEGEMLSIEVNVKGFTCVSDWGYRYFAQRGGGHLVAITSIAGVRGNYDAPAYGASKAYNINYLQGLRWRAAREHLLLTITDIRPGWVDTALAQGNRVFWVQPVEKSVRQIYKAIRQKRKTAYITKRWRIIAVFMRILPDWIYNRI